MMMDENQSMLRTFLEYAIPCIAGLFLTSFITIVDGMFIAWKMGEQGLAAVNLTLPVLYILLALTIMSGAGGVTLAAQSLGEGNRGRANYYFTYSLVINVIVNLIALLILVLFEETVLRLLNAGGVLKGLVRDFLGTIKFFYLFMMANLTFSIFIRGEGKPQLPLVFGVVANLLNIGLDYLFIFRFNLGMRGAALATGLSVTLAFGLGLAYFLSKRSVFKLRPIVMNPNDLKRIAGLGSAEFVAQISLSIIVYIFNWVLLKRIGVQGVAAMTIVGYVSFVQNMILTGIAVGIHPMLSYWSGAKRNRAIAELTAIALLAAVVVGAAVFAAACLQGRTLAGIFAKGDESLLEMAAAGLKLFSLSFLLNGYNMIAAAYFTSLGDAKKAAIISTLRGLFLVIPLILTLPLLIGNAGIWLAPAVAELMVFGLAYYWMRKSGKELRGEGWNGDLGR